MSDHKGEIVSDWSRVNIDSAKSRRQLYSALNNYLQIPFKHPIIRQAAQAYALTGRRQPIQAFATGDDFPESVLQVLEKFFQETYFDVGYERIFNMKDMRNVKRSSFEILDVTSGLTFEKTKIGERAKLYKMSGEKTTVSVYMYSGGLHWHRTLFDDEEYWTLEDNARAFRNKAYSSKAQDFYDLIDGVEDTYDLDWQEPEPANVSNTNENYTALRDIKTINTAVVSILTNVKDLGFGVGPDTEFILLAPIQLKDRIPMAMNKVFQPFQGSTRQVVYNVTPIYTMMLDESDKYYIILPKRKIIGATRMDLKVLAEMSITTYSDLAVGWQRYGGAIGEDKQIVRCSTSA